LGAATHRAQARLSKHSYRSELSHTGAVKVKKMKRNVLIEIEYDGSGFSGWQTQPNARTVQGELTRALRVVCGEEIRLNGTSRTDAGVHAYGQAASFTGDFGIPAERIPIASNNLLDDIKIISARDMPPEFHARFDAKRKTYLYRVSVSAPGTTPDIFLRKYRWQIVAEPATEIDKTKYNLTSPLPFTILDRASARPEIIEALMNMLDATDSMHLANYMLDINNMHKAVKALIGTHDFSSFRSAGGNPDIDPVKTITNISIDEFMGFDTRNRLQIEYEIRVIGNGFLYNMVRIIVGTLIEIGLGKREPESVTMALAARDRSLAGSTAPAAGLWLERVHFDENVTPHQVR
jgi:tRNA pseudouridine38-40 synthase